jgi:hypothetical protein
VSTTPPTPTPVIMREWFGVSHLRMINGGGWGGGLWVGVAVAGP